MMIVVGMSTLFIPGILGILSRQQPCETIGELTNELYCLKFVVIMLRNKLVPIP